MSYQITVSEDRAYVRVSVHGPVTIPMARKYTEESAALGARLGIRSFLFDVRGAPNVETPLPIYRFAYEELPAFPLDPGASSAILASPGDESHDFVEVSLKNAGFDVRLFRDEESAVGWLLERKQALATPCGTGTTS